MKIGDKIYFVRNAEDMYREMTRLSNPRGQCLVQGIYEVVKIGRKRYHLDAIWIETEKSTDKRHYHYQEDLVGAIDNGEDIITRFYSYNSARAIPFRFLNQLVESGELVVLNETIPWIVAFTKHLLTA